MVGVLDVVVGPDVRPAGARRRADRDDLADAVVGDARRRRCRRWRRWWGRRRRRPGRVRHADGRCTGRRRRSAGAASTPRRARSRSAPMPPSPPGRRRCRRPRPARRRSRWRGSAKRTGWIVVVGEQLQEAFGDLDHAAGVGAHVDDQPAARHGAQDPVDLVEELVAVAHVERPQAQVADDSVAGGHLAGRDRVRERRSASSPAPWRPARARPTSCCQSPGWKSSLRARRAVSLVASTARRVRSSHACPARSGPSTARSRATRTGSSGPVRHRRRGSR